jgi:GT2 family glycosyltransferase
LRSPVIAVAIPTLHGGPLLDACLASLARQTETDFEVIVIDNSSAGNTATHIAPQTFSFPLRVHASGRNLGFAESMNIAWSQSQAAYLAALNDDAEVSLEWLARLRAAMESSPDIGMCASRVLVHGTQTLDSAGMLIASDGSSKQRGQGRCSSAFAAASEVLFPSASAALYRRQTLEEIGWFDKDFFLYCEDTDLGLRARWRGWRCLYVPEAVVEHHYSQSAGFASPLKAYQIERNRLWVAMKNFPLRLLWRVPFASAARYFWHAFYLLQGRGTAARFGSSSSQINASRLPFRAVLQLAAIILRAHFALIPNTAQLLRKRRFIRSTARIKPSEFATLLDRHAISPREIARL